MLECMINSFNLDEILEQAIELDSELVNEGVKHLIEQLGYPECDTELGLKLGLCEYGYDLTGLFNNTEETKVVWFWETTYMSSAGN